MRVIDLDVELLRQLAVDRLDDLTDGVGGPLDGPWQLLPLVATRRRQQADAVVSPQLGRLLDADVRLVTNGGEVGMLAQQFEAHLQVGGVGRGQLEVEDDSAQRDQEVEFVAEDGLFLGRHLAEGGSVGFPIPARGGHQVELDNGHRQTVQHALPILGQVQVREHNLSDEVESLHH